MKQKQNATSLILISTILMLLVVPANAQSMKSYPAHMTVEGTLTLIRTRGEPIDFVVNANFTSVIPSVILPGTYENIEFRGSAHTIEGRALINIEGLLTVDNYNFWVKFLTEKPEEPQIPGGWYSASGTLYVTISEITHPPPEIMWVLMKGRITQYGENDAYGGLTAHAKITSLDNWTKVHGVFTLSPFPTEETTAESFSRSFYVVTLAEATKTELNNGENNLYIEGLWNVYNRTITVTIVEDIETTITITIRPIAELVPGNLTVHLTSEPSLTPLQVRGSFKLQIEEINTIIGDVVFYHVRFARPAERGIPLGDFNRDRVVNILDIVHIARAYGTKLGLQGYDFDLDLNSDFIINILDLAKAAQEFGEEY